MHILRWDLDRTYLDTDIRSVRGLVRAAIESAAEKRHIPGAPALLRTMLEHDPHARASMLSGSPRQLRAVLEQRLILDGIRFDNLVLKDNLGNLRRGRLRALRGQVGYKLPHLLALRLSAQPSDRESLFGDDAEVDALIYALYASILAGEVGDDTVLEVMSAGGAYDDQLDHARRSLDRLRRADVVDGIWIHVDRGLPLTTYRTLGARVRVVFGWMQAAVAMVERDHLSEAGAAGVVAAWQGDARAADADVLSLLQDAVRRRLCAPDTVRAILRHPPAAHLMREADAALDALGPPPAPPAAAPVDWMSFLHAARPDVDVASPRDRG